MWRQLEPAVFVTAQPLTSLPQKSPLQPSPATKTLLFIPNTLEYENIVGGSVKSLSKVKVIATHCSCSIHKTNNFILEGSGVGQALFTLGQSMLCSQSLYSH